MNAPPPPGPPVRAEGVFTAVDALFCRADALLSRWIPEESNPLARAGAACNLCLLVAVATGVALLPWYSPSASGAHASVQAMAPGTLGGWVRALHRYSSDLAMLLLLLHGARTLFARKLAGPRWLAWTTGVGLAALVWSIGWTGYWLVWDQPAQQVATTSIGLLDALPVFGEPLGRLLLADRLVPSLLFFIVFFLHMLLPLGIAVGLVLHLARLSRARLLPGRGLSAALALSLAAAAFLLPAPLDAPARMAERAAAFTVDAWYLTPLALSLRLQHGGLWAALLGTLALAGLLPWILGRRRAARAAVARVTPARCHACTQCVQDCPFDAIGMVPRSDGRPWPSQAEVDPARCVGCGVCAGSCDSDGIGIPWLETRAEEARVEQSLRAAGSAPRVALVCAETAGGWPRFNPALWKKWLPGWQVYPVPTSSWIQPKWVERLLRSGVRSLLIVRDARAESWSRDGRTWVAQRLLGERAPRYRPTLAGNGDGRWRIVDHDAARPHSVAAAAQALESRTLTGAPDGRPPAWRTAAAGVVLALALTAATVVPSRLRVANPADPAPELVLSLKAFGAWQEPALVAAEDASRPVHMRGRSTAKPHRAPVRVRLSVDGAVEQREFSGKGLSHDGPALVEWRMPLTPGLHAVRVELEAGPAAQPLVWEGQVLARERRSEVLTYAPGDGFRLE